MKEFKYAIRRFFRGGSLNIIKVIGLGLGFAISFLLLSKVSYELSYDTYIKDLDRVYQIYTNVDRGDADKKDYNQVSGAVASGMKKEIPQVEAATRWTVVTDNSFLYIENDRPIDYETEFIADENFFDIFTTEIISGDPKQILTQKMQCMISDELAEKMGGDVIDKQFRFRSFPNTLLTIKGVFKRFPKNSSYNTDIVISMKSLGEFTYDGSENWIGNDRYIGFVKLTPGTNPEDLKESIYKMQQKYQDIDKLQKENNVFFTYPLIPVKSIHLKGNIDNTSVLLVGIIGLIVLVMSLLNYLLLRVTSIINNSKNTGIQKSLGAEQRDIMKGIIVDTIFHIIVSLIIAVLFIIVFRKSLGDILDISVTYLLTPSSILIGLVLLLLSGVFISFGPGRLVAKQPVINTIRDHQRKSRQWKMVLLFIEALGVAFLVSTVFFVQKQYDHSMKMDKGFDVQNVYGVPTSAMDSLGVKNSMERLRNMPEVEMVSLSCAVPYDQGQSGDNLFDPVTEKEIRNVADLFWCDENYMNIFKIPIVEGQGLDKGECNGKTALINETFANHLVLDFGWKDGVIGKEINVTSHYNPVTIVGVFKDIRISRNGKIFTKDESIIVAGGAWYKFSYIMNIRLKDSNPETIKAVQNVINEYTTFGDVELTSAEKMVNDQYNNMRNLGNYTIFGSIIAIIIALIGIIGYTEEEVARRRKEIAIRKVNGAKFGDIVFIFITRYLKVGVPATLLGLVLAFFAIQKWVQTLEDQIDLPILVFFLLGVVILVVSSFIMTVYCYFAANQNPTKYLSEE